MDGGSREQYHTPLPIRTRGDQRALFYTGGATGRTLVADLGASRSFALGSSHILGVPLVVDLEGHDAAQPRCHVAERGPIRREQSVAKRK